MWQIRTLLIDSLSPKHFQHAWIARGSVCVCVCICHQSEPFSGTVLSNQGAKWTFFQLLRHKGHAVHGATCSSAHLIICLRVKGSKSFWWSVNVASFSNGGIHSKKWLSVCKAELPVPVHCDRNRLTVVRCIHSNNITAWWIFSYWSLYSFQHGEILQLQSIIQKL